MTDPNSPDTHPDSRACARLCRSAGVGDEWREAIDALAFRPAGHGGVCAVHRLAFRALLGRVGTPAECLAYFAAHRPAFERAAADKIARRGLDGAANLHLTSRDIARAVSASADERRPPPQA